MAVLKVKENGEWKEVQAIKGADGHTPVKGTDYFTQEDIASLNIPSKTSDLTNDDNTVKDSSYVHTDNNYTTDEKTKLASLENYDDTQISNALNNKVDKVANMGLSENSFTDTDKINLDNNTANRHTHTNKSILDSTTASYTTVDKSNLDNNTANRHTHSNKTVLDGISSANVNNWNTKQDTLVSGQNIKTINNQNILGSGDITIQSGGSEDYEELNNLPKVNNVELKGNKTSSDLGLQPAGNYALSSDIPTVLSDLTDDTTHRLVTDTEKTTWNNKSNFSGNYPDLSANPVVLLDYEEGTDVNINSLVVPGEIVTYQFLNSVNLKKLEVANSVELAPGNTITISENEASFVCPGGNYYVFPDGGVSSTTTWGGGYCVTGQELDDAIADLDVLEEYKIVSASTATGTITFVDNTWYRRTATNGITRLTFTFPDTINYNYRSKITLKTSANFTGIAVTDKAYDIYFTGDDCANGVFTPQASKYYKIEAEHDGFTGLIVNVFSK